MRVVAIIIAIGAIACSFDESGVPSSVATDGGRLADAAQWNSDGRVETPDAAPVACTDRDGDQFMAVGVPGSSCGEQLDCDDDDPFAYPGQPDYFANERVSGGYDFDCDGAETPLDTTTGSDCHWDWWDCVGTGWISIVPACGHTGIYHICEDTGGRCQETASDSLQMPCR